MKPARTLLVAILCLGALSTSTAQRSGSPADATTRMVAAAQAFLITLDAGQRVKANIDLNLKTRTVWSNLPSGATLQSGATERNGLKLADMTPPQEKAALALVAAALSRDGFQKAMAIVDADQLLEQRSAPTRPAAGRPRFGRGEYYVAILGAPSATDKWMLQFGGHHLAINVTIADRENVLTPTHTGVQPATLQRRGQNGPSAWRRERQGVRADQRAQPRAAEAGRARVRGAKPRARSRRPTARPFSPRGCAHRPSTPTQRRC